MMFSFYFSIEYKHAITVEYNCLSSEKLLISKSSHNEGSRSDKISQLKTKKRVWRSISLHCAMTDSERVIRQTKYERNFGFYSLLPDKLDAFSMMQPEMNLRTTTKVTKPRKKAGVQKCQRNVQSLPRAAHSLAEVAVKQSGKLHSSLHQSQRAGACFHTVICPKNQQARVCQLLAAGGFLSRKCLARLRTHVFEFHISSKCSNSVFCGKNMILHILQAIFDG